MNSDNSHVILIGIKNVVRSKEIPSIIHLTIIRYVYYLQVIKRELGMRFGSIIACVPPKFDNKITDFSRITPL